MPRCKACDVCDTVGEPSPYREGLQTTRGQVHFIIDPITNDVYCSVCYAEEFNIYLIDEEWDAL